VCEEADLALAVAAIVVAAQLRAVAAGVQPVLKQAAGQQHRQPQKQHVSELGVMCTVACVNACTYESRFTASWCSCSTEVARVEWGCALQALPSMHYPGLLRADCSGCKCCQPVAVGAVVSSWAFLALHRHTSNASGNSSTARDGSCRQQQTCAKQDSNCEKSIYVLKVQCQTAQCIG
jgi:hypothetical protein